MVDTVAAEAATVVAVAAVVAVVAAAAEATDHVALAALAVHSIANYPSRSAPSSHFCVGVGRSYIGRGFHTSALRACLRSTAIK